MKTEMGIMSERIRDNAAKILATEGTTKRLQDGIRDLTIKINNVITALRLTTKFLNDLPSTMEVGDHPVAMDEQVARIQELNNGLKLRWKSNNSRKVLNIISVNQWDRQNDLEKYTLKEEDILIHHQHQT
jgi:hypothetical protein